MQHVEIAFDLLVILIGFAALSIAVFWALRTAETHLRSFCLVYALFTLVLIITLLKKYLLLNFEGYSARSWFLISGLLEIVHFALVVGLIHFWLAVYRIRGGKTLAFVTVLLMLLSDGLILSPVGAVLDAARKTIHFGPGFQVASAVYLLLFTFAMVLGYGWLHRIWNTDKRAFVVGLLIFATVGYAETLLSLWPRVRNPAATVALASENDFIFSSIPYALYGIFVIAYFLNYSVPSSAENSPLVEAFLTKYGITEREREIIRKVVQGKSNADIAGDLFLSTATVKTHLHNIYGKIGVNSRYSLLARLRAGQ